MPAPLVNPSIYIVKEIVSIGLCHFVFPRFGNRDSFPVFHEEVPVFQRFNVIHIDQAIPVTPQKLGIGFQHGREIGKRHIGTYYAGHGVDLDIMIGIIGIYNIINQDSGLIPSFLDLDVVDEFLGGFFKTLQCRSKAGTGPEERSLSGRNISVTTTTRKQCLPP